MKKITLFILLCTSTIFVQAQLNLSFEDDAAGVTDPTGWTWSNDHTGKDPSDVTMTVKVVADATAPEGSNSLEVTTDANNKGSCSPCSKLSNDVLLTFEDATAGGQDVKIRITFKTKTNVDFAGGNDFKSQIVLNGTASASGNPSDAVDNWWDETDTFTFSGASLAGTNTINLNFIIGKLPANAVINIDAISIIYVQLGGSNVTLATEKITISDNSIMLYPNPATSILNYSAVNIVAIEVYNILGQQVLEEKNTSGSIDVSAFKSGIYILKLKGENGAVSTKKFSVK